ncbi:FadR/GntR family transcriptional regulator [Dactylosporangium sucinum]|uniref:GntR family transcriptional regulator n=1 Tax=Dactylosporangium sucinum TaxID=1424081 RepID=A0A917X0J2_9ACTN|nr:FCD domain-containing protein [Dactylosporangium sucinum]GGM54280.1 GntR family transcriptional regulator [Dactylosporangium sucinum]
MQRSHERVIAHVEAALAAGDLRVGSRLPAERVLAAELGVSRATVREGLRVLEAMGLVRIGVGSGPASGAVVTADTAAGLSAALRLHLASTALPVRDVVRTRVVLESWSVRGAAAAGPSPALDEAAELLARSERRGIAPGEFYALDTEFHLALTRAAGNAVVTAMMAALRGAIAGYVQREQRQWTRLVGRLRTEHRAVLEAVTTGDAELAARRVVAHIEGFYRQTLR